MRYLGATSTMDLPPHIYALGLHAVKGLQQHGGTSQVVLISGESGAGKTESAKLVMSYISEALGSSRNLQRRDSRPRYSVAADTARRRSRYSVVDPAKPSIQDKIIQTNPILEAFGNAMTVRNNNSSRFGKWTQMIISPNMAIQGCSVTDYLLEVTRVCGCGEKERNYHIFFQLLQARADPQLQDLDIQAPEEYNYIKGSRFTAPGIDDTRCFQEVKEAFLALEFSPEVQKEIFKVVVGLLVVGNIDFVDGDEAEIKGSDVDKASQLLGIPSKALQEMILVQKRKIGGEVVNSRRSTAQAKSVRDTFARMLYGRTFKWLIEKINDRLRQSSTSQVFLGVLDIAGFESFEHNSLEQLFINLSNEILQSHFNQHFFRMELQEYEAEGIKVGIDVTYQDNSDIVSLINAKGGILSILDDEALIPKTTDQTFVSKVIKSHGNHARIVKSKMGGAVKFGIKHFAGEVTYDASGFLEKNMSKLPDEAGALLLSSSSSLLEEIGKKVQEEVETENRSRGRKAKTVSSGFRQSLEELMQTVNSAEPHFIRCLKPNAAKEPNNFDSKYTYEQMLYSGIFEAVRIRQSGFPMRLLHAEFLERYGRLMPKEQWPQLVGPRQVSPPEKVELLVSALREQLTTSDLPDKGLVLGKTKVLGKALTMSLLEEIRHKTLLAQKQEQEAAVEELERAIKGRNPEALLAALVEGEFFQLDRALLDEGRKALEHEEKRMEIMKGLHEAINLREVPRLRQAIKEAEDFGLDHADDLAVLEEAVTTMQKELWPQARAGLTQAVACREIKKLQDALAEAELVGLPTEEMKPARQILQEEERKVAAMEGLKEPLRLRDIAAMQAAIAEGEAAGLSAGDLEGIKTALAEEQRKATARTALQSAVKSRKVPELQAALEEGEACQLEGSELYEAKRILADEQSKMQARSAVEKATQSRDVTELRAALKQGLAWGLEEAELQRARMILKQEEIKLEALRALEDALRSRDIEELQAAIRQGQSSNLDPSQLRPARTALEEEQKKLAARSGLEKAIKRRDINALMRALTEAEKAGLSTDVDEEMRVAKETLATEQAKAASKEQLAKAMKDLCYDTIPALREAIQEAELQGLDAVLVDPAKAKLETTERQLAAKIELQDALATRGISELASAISSAEAAGLHSADEHLAEARRTHADEKRRVKAQQGLFDAVQSRNIEQLHKALEEGKVCSLNEDDLREANDVLMEELRKANAREGLQRATWSRSILDLRSAIAEAEDAGVDEDETMEARQMLGIEEGKEEARNGLETAVQSRNVEMLEDALEEADRCGLVPKETETARQILAEEQRKLAALEGLNEAIASKDIAALEAAILEAQQADLDATEVDTAKSLLELELQKIALWKRLEKAQQQRVINELRDALSAAMNLGFSLSELAPAQSVLKEEERKETAREALAEAVSDPDVATLEAALKEAVDSGLMEEEMVAAKDALQLAQRLVETRNDLESAVKTRDPARLMAAIEKGQSCGLERHELEPAEAVLKEARVEQTRESLKRAINEQDVRALFRAVAESEAVGLEPEELDEAKRVLEEEAALATKDAEHRLERRQLLLPAAELTFEVARPALDAEGYGGFDWKVRENIAFSTVAVGQELAAALEKAWFTKKSNILDELCQNLHSCHMSSIGRLCKPEALDKHVLLKLGLDLKMECDTSENWASSPIALAAMLFYTQQDVDIDRALLFPDCPSSMVAAQLFKERKEAYDAYRTRTSALGARNPMLFSEVSHVATAVLQSALRGLQQAPDVTTERPLQKWVKTACLLSSCRQKFEDSKSLTRILTNVSERGVQELRKKQKEDIIVCPQLLSTSSNPDYVQKYLSLGASSLEKHVILTISNVTECLDLSAVSQYPDEQEVLLPFLSVLRVQDVSFEAGQATRVRCQFQGSMLSPRLRSACLSDLTMASYELVQGLDDLPIPSPISVSLGESKTDRPNLRDHTQYNTKVFQTLVHAFEALDRRGAWMISYSDYSWAQDTLASSVGVKRILRKLTGHFANSHLDLTLQKFFVLTMPGATDSQLERAFRWTSRYLRTTEPQRLEESPSASPQSPQTPVIRTTTPKHPRLRTWR